MVSERFVCTYSYVLVLDTVSLLLLEFSLHVLLPLPVPFFVPSPLMVTISHTAALFDSSTCCCSSSFSSLPFTVRCFKHASVVMLPLRDS